MLLACTKAVPLPGESPAALANRQTTLSHVASTIEIQSALADKGIKINPDGKMGPETKIALKTFQQRNGLKVTGIADTATLTKLGL